MIVKYSYLKKQFSNSSDLWKDLKKFVSTGDFTLGKPLTKVKGNSMRISGYPQICVTIDIAGNIYLFREAGFLDRPGNEKFIIGKVDGCNVLC